ncbi:MAG TPA: hypothetical protein VE089_07670 [Nitrososphaeraceae archaeon]|jgi:hypothetical protein|nr:hypothetical protein [Nitrososphaeraceae archaeon]
MKLNNKIPWALVMATLGATATGALNTTVIFGIASVVLGGCALITALLTRQRVEKRKLKPALAEELR